MEAHLPFKMILWHVYAFLGNDKHTFAQAYARNNRKSFARQRVSKQAFSTVEAVFSVGSVQSGYKEVLGNIEGCIEWRVEIPDATLPKYELGSRGILLSRVFGIGSCTIMARKELGCEKKT
jgi:hypothetical protein